MSESVSAKNFLKKIKNLDAIKIGNIKSNWPEKIKGLKKLVKKYPDYTEHRNQKKIKAWGDKPGYNEHNTKIWKSTTKEPTLQIEWQNELLDFLPIENGIVTPTLQTPGNILPIHIDRFLFIKKKYHVSKSKSVVRFLLFLEDWKDGHFLQVRKTIITKWKKGDIILWYPTHKHLSANVGTQDKWTCNITAILKQKISRKFLDFVDLTN